MLAGSRLNSALGTEHMEYRSGCYCRAIRRKRLNRLRQFAGPGSEKCCQKNAAASLARGISSFRLATRLVMSAVPVAFPDFVSVQRATARARAGADQRPLLAADDAAEGRARGSGPGHSQLIAMLLPEGAMIAMITAMPRLC